jgi:hypothetical protein
MKQLLLVVALLGACTEVQPPVGSDAAPEQGVVSLGVGLPPGDTGTRTVFHASDEWGLFTAGLAAAAVGGAVVLDNVIEIYGTVYYMPGVLYTGGGVKRVCNQEYPWTLYGLFTPYSSATYPGGTIIDNMLIDGNWTPDCNQGATGVSHMTGSFRGRNILRNLVVMNTPSENFTVCGTQVENVVAYNLGGSFIHKSCTEAVGIELDTVHNVQVYGSNLLGDAVLGHSEGAITLSNAAGHIVVTNSTFAGGNEAFIGDRVTEANLLIVGSQILGFDPVVRELTSHPDHSYADPVRFVDTVIQ